jgi:hypothetical protein
VFTYCELCVSWGEDGSQGKLGIQLSIGYPMWFWIMGVETFAFVGK